MVQVYGLDALEKAFVEPHVVGVLGEYRLHLLRQGVHLVVRLGTQQVEEYG